MLTAVRNLYSRLIENDSKGNADVRSVVSLTHVIDPFTDDKTRKSLYALTGLLNTVHWQKAQAKIILIIGNLMKSIGAHIEVKEDPDTYFKNLHEYMDKIIEKKGKA